MSEQGKIVYWHRGLPPLHAEVMGEHTVEATSSRVPGTISHQDELWDRCYQELMANTRARNAYPTTATGSPCASARSTAIKYAGYRSMPSVPRASTASSR